MSLNNAVMKKVGETVVLILKQCCQQLFLEEQISRRKFDDGCFVETRKMQTQKYNTTQIITVTKDGSGVHTFVSF